jgi:hypothetical protein
MNVNGLLSELTIVDTAGGDHSPFLLKDDPIFDGVDVFVVCFSTVDVNTYVDAYYTWALEAHALHPVRDR